MRTHILYPTLHGLIYRQLHRNLNASTECSVIQVLLEHNAHKIWDISTAEGMFTSSINLKSYYATFIFLSLSLQITINFISKLAMYPVLKIQF